MEMKEEKLALPLRLSGTTHLLDAYGHIVGGGISGLHAQEIMTSVNSHKDLLEALEAWMKFENSVTQGQEREFRELAINLSKSAIAKARGEQGK